MLPVRLDGRPGQAIGMGGRVADLAGHVKASPRVSFGVGDGRGDHVGHSLQTGPSGPDSISPDGPDTHRRLSSPGIAERGRAGSMEPDARHARLAHMHTPPRRLESRRRGSGLVLAVLVASALVACGSSAASPAGTSPGGAPATVAPTEDPDTSVGIDLPAASDDPALIDPLGRVVTPKPGQLDVRAIPAQRLSATVDGRRVTLTIDYSSGVEPCYILDSIVVAVGADAGTFAVTLREGHG